MVEFGRAIDIHRQVAITRRLRVVVGTRIIPAIPAVRRRCPAQLDDGIDLPARNHNLSGVDIAAAPALHGQHRVATIANDQCAGIAAHLDSVVAATVGNELGVGRIDFHLLAIAQAAQIEADIAHRHSKLPIARIVPDQNQLAVGHHADEVAGPYLNFDIGPLAGCQRIAGNQCGVDLSGRPLGVAGTPKIGTALDDGQPGRRRQLRCGLIDRLGLRCTCQ